MKARSGDNAGRRNRGFTLIEILVVVAIIALLVSILLPSLNQAREQSKIVKCLANLSSLGKASFMYLQGNKEQFCWGPGPQVVDASGIPLTRTWYFGGNRGQDSLSLGTIDSNMASQGYGYKTGSTHDWGPADRPLNKYAYSLAKLSKNDRRPLSQPGDLRLFECPSDKGLRWNGAVDSQLNYAVTGFLEVGSSYDENLSWNSFAKQEYGKTGPAIQKRTKYLMDRIIKIFIKRGASRMVLLYEDTADWALNTQLPLNFKVISWHNKINIHNLLFVDGHAAPLFVDYTKNWYDQNKVPDPAGTANWGVRQRYKEEGN